MDFPLDLLLGNDGDDFLEEIGSIIWQGFLNHPRCTGIHIFFIRPRKGIWLFLSHPEELLSDLLLSLGTILLSIGMDAGDGNALLGPGFLKCNWCSKSDFTNSPYSY